MSGPHDLTGRTLDGRYRVTKLLGEGGMGHVYEAIHTALGRKVAIKTLHPRLAYEERFRERFIREAKSASSIQHPNVVQIMDFGDTPDGSVYFVMEHLEGRDLGSLLREQGKLPWARTREILVQAVRALAAAHAQSIVHRDIKPGNCFLTTTGAGQQQELVKLLDFGIAKVGTEAEGGDGGPRLTGTGEVFGTASYMAPEQARGEPLDARSDLYSLGIMAYEMLTGQVPFTGINSLHVITKHLTEKPKPPRVIEPEIPPAVEAVVLRAIAKEAKDRFASMVELEAVLLGIAADARAPQRGKAVTGSARPVGTGASTGVGQAVKGASVGSARPASTGAATRSAPPVKGVGPAGVARPASGSAAARSVGAAKGGGVGVAAGPGRSSASSERPKVPPPRSGAGVGAVKAAPGVAPGAASRGVPPRAVPSPAARSVATSGDAVPSSRSHARTEPAEDAPSGGLRRPPGAPVALPSAARDPSYPSHPSLGIPRPLAASDVSGELGRGVASGPIAVDGTGQTTVPPPGQLDHTTSPSISLRVSSQTGSSKRMTGANAVDTSPHVLGSPSAPRSIRTFALALGAIALVSVGSIAATLAVLRSGSGESGAGAENLQEIREVTAPATSRDESEKVTPGNRVEAGAARTSSEAAAPLDVPSRGTPAAGTVEDALAVPGPAIEPDDAIELPDEIEPDAEPEPADAAPAPAGEEPDADAASPTTKRPQHLTQPCIDRRAKAQAALGARAWKDLLAATSKAWCWPLAEQDARRRMRVLAYLDLGNFDACIASGRGVKDKQTREAVKTCEELRAR